MENKRQGSQFPNVRHGLKKSVVETDLELREVRLDGKISFFLANS
jgi:hypothetical protein